MITIHTLILQEISVSENGDETSEIKVMLLVDDGNVVPDILLLCKIMSIIGSPELGLANDCAQKIAIINEKERKKRELALKMRQYCCAKNAKKVQQKTKHSLSRIQNIAIPAQCKKALTNVRTR